MDKLLETVKTGLGIVGTFHADILKVYISEVKEVMIDVGVSEALFDTDKVNGCVIRGVADLWNYGQGNASLSPYFYQRVTQLAREVIEDVPTN